MFVGFVGLVNQAMTCYLNSLLQTLFMTPEFRNALYRLACSCEGGGDHCFISHHTVLLHGRIFHYTLHCAFELDFLFRNCLICKATVCLQVEQFLYIYCNTGSDVSHL